VASADIEAFAATRGMLWIETSAKTGEGIEAIFERSAEELLRRRRLPPG
jgi:hypothetical protein